MANKNTELEQELLNELLKIEALLMTLRVTRDVTVKVSEMVQLNIILKKIKETYPSVRFPVELGSGCGACVYDFIMSLQPVYDRLKSQDFEAKQTRILKLVQLANNNVIVAEDITDAEIDAEIEKLNNRVEVGSDEIKEEPAPKRGRRKK